MDKSQLRPAYACAAQYGVKILAYGGPGSGKTPLIRTAPRPVVCATEPGLLSIRDWDGPVWEAYTPTRINEFFHWIFSSNEASNFDTVVIDSISQMAEIILVEMLKTNKHGLQGYGQMAQEVMKKATQLYFLKNKHICLIAKQCFSDEGNGIRKKRPYLPGNECNIKLPHLYDEILYIGVFNIPEVSGSQRAIQTMETPTITARDRSGQLEEFEPCDLSRLISKCMS